MARNLEHRALETGTGRKRDAKSVPLEVETAPRDTAQVHGIGVVRHADLRPPGRGPAGAVTATLHLPDRSARPSPCMVILTSSAGVQRHRERYYADSLLTKAGVAALIVDKLHRTRRATYRRRPGHSVSTA